MNVYEKLQEVRVELQNMNLKRVAKTLLVNMNYFELRLLTSYQYPLQEI